MNKTNKWRPLGQLAVVLFCAGLVKLYYSTASVNELRWILAPTTALVEFFTGTRFQFESHAGYMSSDHTFLIAASCAGVNFLITSFLMLSLRKLWANRSKVVAWRFFALAAVFAYLATLIANTVRISSALLLRRTPLEIGLSPDQLHRFEGIFVYFGFLLLLFLVSERYSGTEDSKRMPCTSPKKASERLDWLRRSLFPLLVYYGVTLGIPLANGAYRQGSEFREHSLFVLLTPLLLLLPFAILVVLVRVNSWFRVQVGQSSK